MRRSETAYTPAEQYDVIRREIQPFEGELKNRFGGAFFVVRIRGALRENNPK